LPRKFGRYLSGLIAPNTAASELRACGMGLAQRLSTIMTRLAISDEARAARDLRPIRWCAACALSLAVLCSPRRAPAVEIPVFLGDVGVGKQTPQVQAELRSLLRAELSATDFAQVKTHDRFVLSATLVRLDSVLASDSVRATCVISVALLRDNGATLHAVIRGRATAEESKTQADVARSDALRGAVHSAITRVPQALL
jgi:hypothetical protein